jgi:hypothetical protein
MRPPPRLLHDPTVSSELRTDLERTAQTPSDYDVAAGLVVLQAALGAAAATTLAAKALGAGQDAAASTKAAGALGGAAKAVIAATAAGALAAFATWSLYSVPRRAPPRARAPSMAAPALEPSSTPVASRSPQSAAPSATQSNLGTTHADAAQPMLAPHARIANANPDAALKREIVQLGRIKALMESDPAEAYRLAKAGHREFDRGMLREEREALALLALWKLGKRDAAQSGIDAFIARYPRSPMRERLLNLLRTEAN